MKVLSIIFILFFHSLIFNCFLVKAQDTTSVQKSLSFEASYIGDNMTNLAGGIKTGYEYLGIVSIGFGFNSENARLWKGGQFYLSAANTHGSSPSIELSGDIQVASNIEAGNHTFLQQLWFKQTFGKIDFTAGLQDLNTEFACIDHGSLFINSSFGILPTISGNITAPIFPLTALGLTTKWNISDNISWLTAIYDGCPTGFENNPHNLNWEFLSGDGFLAISEFQKKLELNRLPGLYKFGFFIHNHFIQKTFGIDIPDSTNYNIAGFFIHADQKVWQLNKKNIGIFIQLGYSPAKYATNNFYLGLGINYTGIFNTKGNDILGLAIAHDRLTGHKFNETAIELTYQYSFLSNLFIQPDFQYIINPAGTGEKLSNSFIFNLRFGISI